MVGPVGIEAFVGPSGGSVTYDEDAELYFAKVRIADGQPLSSGVKSAVNDLIVGLKADSLWTPIKAACLLAGPSTLAGALVPLIGVEPTNSGFIEADYDPRTGLQGTAQSGKVLLSNRAGNADPQDNMHLACYANGARADSGVNRWMSADAGIKAMFANPFGGARARVNSGTRYDFGTSNSSFGLMGVSRASSAGWDWVITGQSGSIVDASTGTTATTVGVFGDSDATPESCGAKLAFYSIGEALDLSALDARLDTYVEALAAL